MKNLGKIVMEIGLVLMAVLALPSLAQAATGDLAGNVTFSQDCSSGLGVGIAYDGTNLWYSCYANQTDLFRASPTTGVVSASYQLNNGLGALSYDATRNVIWAGQGAGNGNNGDIFMIQLNATKDVTSFTTQFTILNSVPINPPGCFFCTVGDMNLDDGLAFDARNIADPSDDVIYFSPDTATIINVFNLTGSKVENFTWSGVSDYNSGLAVGGNLLYEGSNGSSHVWVVNKTTKAPQFNFSTIVAGDPNFRDEDLECDTNTFAPIDVMWSKEAYSPMRAHAFEIPKGTCGVGGKPTAPKGSISGMKFNDLNGNGVNDAEPGLAKWTITLTNDTGVTIIQTTAPDGSYNFTNLTDGNYTIGEVIQPSWIQTAPAVSATGSATYKVQISGGNAVTSKDFGNFKKGKITGGGWIPAPGDPKATFGLVGQYPDKSNTAQGNVEYQDHAAKLNIKSIQINTVTTTIDKKKGVITGLAQVNGAGSYYFEVYVEDNGEPGKGVDVFKISLPTYPYSNGAVLSFGNIQIHE